MKLDSKIADNIIYLPVCLIVYLFKVHAERLCL